jgi:hypothetical protein
MLLTGPDATITLRPLGYQFPSTRGEFYDDNWLVVEGRVTTPAGNWRFQDPALLQDEALAIARWLRRAAEGRVPVTVPDEDGELSPSLSFLEPNLAFSLAAREGTRSVLRVHLSLEAAPPWLPYDEDLDELHQYTLDLPCEDADLLRAATEWERELAPFPAR